MVALPHWELLGGAALVAVSLASAPLKLSGGDRKKRLRALATLLRAPDPHTRIDSLERAQSLPSKERSYLAKLLRQELLAASASTGSTMPAMTVWFIRQILALLGDSRVAVRMDAARLLRAVVNPGTTPINKDEWTNVAPAVLTTIELAGGKVLADSLAGRQETRTLALAEMLASGLRPLAVGMEALEGVGEETLGSLTAALKDRNPRVRRTLAEVLAATGGERSIALLIPLLQDPTPELRARAAEALGELKAEAAAEQLVQLLQDPVADVRAAAAAALGEVGVTSASPPLLVALAEECRREDSAESTRAAMIEAIAKLSDGSKPELSRALNELPRPVASRLALALEKSGVVEACLSEPEYEQWAELFAAFLGRVASLGVARPFLDHLDSAEEWVRLRAAAALGHSHDAAALPAVAALLGDPDTKVREQAVDSLAKTADARALSPLAKASSDPERAVRQGAIRGLHQVLAHRSAWRVETLPADFDMKASLTEAHRALLLAAGDALEAVRLEAAGALGLFNSAEGAETLVNLALGDDNETVRRAAAEGLSRSNFAQVRRLLAAALEDRDEARRARAMTILGALGGGEAGRHLLEALHDPASQVREAAFFALARLPAEPLKDRLAPELHNPDPMVRAGVAALLGKARASEYLEALVAALADPEEEVRVNALNALAAMGLPVRKHQTELNARLSDPSPRVREVASAALEALREAWAEAPDPADLLRQGTLSVAGAASLLEMVSEGSFDPLLRALENTRSARVLGEYFSGGGGGALGTLLASLRQFSEGDYARARTALGRTLRQYGSAAGLLAGLKSILPEERLDGVDVAGLLATPEAAAALVEILERDPVAEVRSRAATALGASGESAARAALARAQADDQSKTVRLAASRALQPDQPYPDTLSR